MCNKYYWSSFCCHSNSVDIKGVVMRNDYEFKFIDLAEKIDAITSSPGQLYEIAKSIKETKNINFCKELISKINTIDIEDKKIAGIVNEFYKSFLLYWGAETLKNQLDLNDKYSEDPRSFEELLDELNNLIGLNKVKSQIYDLISFQKIQKLRIENNLKVPKKTLHLAFLGNPGTGKTTVARIIGHMYKKLGLLSKGHFIEVSRTDLIAGYQGQTALKVKNVVEKAKGGVLFIDEAYSITENEHSDSYGRECLTELTKALEDYRDDLVVIVAGYKEPMNSFFTSNPGLKSRFNTFIEFDDYSEQELLEIVLSECKNNEYDIENELKECLINYFKYELSKKEANFANGRLARNVYDDLIMSQAKRLSKQNNITIEDLKLLRLCDFNEKLIPNS